MTRALHSGWLPFWWPYAYGAPVPGRTANSGPLSRHVAASAPPGDAAGRVVGVLPRDDGRRRRYLFFRALALRPAPALVGAAAFALNGFLVGWLAYPNVSQSSFCWLPVILSSGSAAAAGTIFRWIGACAAALGLTMLGGHPQMAIYLWLGWLCMGRLPDSDHRQADSPERVSLGSRARAAWRRTLPGATAAGARFRAAHHSRRARALGDGGASGMPLSQFWTCFLPRLFGDGTLASGTTSGCRWAIRRASLSRNGAAIRALPPSSSLPPERRGPAPAGYRRRKGERTAAAGPVRAGAAHRRSAARDGHAALLAVLAFRARVRPLQCDRADPLPGPWAVACLAAAVGARTDAARMPRAAPLPAARHGSWRRPAPSSAWSGTTSTAAHPARRHRRLHGFTSRTPTPRPRATCFSRCSGSRSRTRRGADRGSQTPALRLPALRGRLSARPAGWCWRSPWSPISSRSAPGSTRPPTPPCCAPRRRSSTISARSRALSIPLRRSNRAGVRLARADAVRPAQRLRSPGRGRNWILSSLAAASSGRALWRGPGSRRPGAVAPAWDDPGAPLLEGSREFATT